MEQSACTFVRDVFYFSVSRYDGSLGEDLFINYVGMKKMEIFLDYSRF